MLGGISPRKAAKTAKGRAKIALWLKFLKTVPRSRIPATRWPSMTSHGSGKSSALPICANDPGVWSGAVMRRR